MCAMDDMGLLRMFFICINDVFELNLLDYK